MAKQHCVKAALILSFGALFMPQMSFAADEEVRVFTKYAISIAGIPVGNARVSTRFKDGKFDIVANGRTAGISRLVSDGKGTLSTSGRLRRGRIVPSKFSMDTVDDKIVTKVRMSMSGGSIKKLLAAPPLSKRPDRIPVESKHRRNILDPLSAFLVSLDNDGRIEPQKACARTIPVFDGWQRFDVRLSYKEKRQARLGGRDGYLGPVVVCKARYVPIAGHRPTRKTTVYLQNNKNMEIWLAPVENVPVLVPVYIKIGTKVGSLTLAASIFEARINGSVAAKTE